MTRDLPPDLRLRLRLHFSDRLLLGPGKLELLEGIRDTGSIAAAGRRMGMSYKRAWSLVEELNAALIAPAVESSRGGSGGGGARLTETGEAIIRHYRALIARLTQDGAGEITAITAFLKEKGQP